MGADLKESLNTLAQALEHTANHGGRLHRALVAAKFKRQTIRKVNGSSQEMPGGSHISDRYQGLVKKINTWAKQPQ